MEHIEIIYKCNRFRVTYMLMNLSGSYLIIHKFLPHDEVGSLTTQTMERTPFSVVSNRRDLNLARQKNELFRF